MCVCVHANAGVCVYVFVCLSYLMLWTVQLQWIGFPKMRLFLSVYQTGMNKWVTCVVTVVFWVTLEIYLVLQNVAAGILCGYYFAVHSLWSITFSHKTMRAFCNMYLINDAAYLLGCYVGLCICGIIYIYIFKMDTPYNYNQIDLQPYCYFRCARLMPLQWHLLKANGQPRMTIYWSCVLYFWNHQHYIFIIYADSFITTDPARRILRSLYRDLDT